jgi:hypothetical protein
MGKRRTAFKSREKTRPKTSSKMRNSEVKMASESSEIGGLEVTPSKEKPVTSLMEESLFEVFQILFKPFLFE